MHKVRPKYCNVFSGDQVRMTMWGGPGGANYSAVTGEYLAGVRAAEGYFHWPIYLLQVWGKNDEFVDFGAVEQHDDFCTIGARGSLWAQRMADVGFVPIDPENQQSVLMGMLCADHPGIFAIEYDDKGREIGCWLAQGSLDCLAPPAGQASVIQTIQAQRKLKGFRGRIHFYFGGGIQQCCYGFEDAREVSARLESRYARLTLPCRMGLATKGPRRGRSSVDLREVFVSEVSVVFAGDDSGRIRLTADRLCTSCYSSPENSRELWSDIYDGGSDRTPQDPRNLLVFQWNPLAK